VHTGSAEPDIDVLRPSSNGCCGSRRIIDHANRRPTATGADVKVGSHEASSASMVSIMTALWFAQLNGDDKVAVEPHASPTSPPTPSGSVRIPSSPRAAAQLRTHASVTSWSSTAPWSHLVHRPSPADTLPRVER